MCLKRSRYIEFSDHVRALKIHPRVIKIFRKYNQKKGELEAGGILLGYLYEHYDEIVKITVPNPLDTRAFFFFNRSKISAQFQINKSWGKSKGSLIYFGEWHTHSEIEPIPSLVDLEMIKKTFTETEMEINFLYLIIVGLNNTYWIGRQSSNGLIKLDEIG